MVDFSIWKTLDALADQLVEKKLVSASRLAVAREKQREHPSRSLCSILVDAGFLDKRLLTAFLGAHLDVPVVDPTQQAIASKDIEKIPAYLARQFCLLPVMMNGDRLLVVMADPGNHAALQELQATYPGTMEIAIGVDEDILKAIAKSYAKRDLMTVGSTVVQVEDYETIGTRVRVGDQVLDLRVATYPTLWGEKVSVRLLTKDLNLNLEALGLCERDQEIFSKIISEPHGMFLVTGPTGSGKTTTLYAAFMKINRLDKNAIAIEDPIENEILAVNQAQVNARAAMTGHLVFTTLHTNSAIGAIMRLLDLGLEPYLIASAVIGIMGQRLVRKICLNCREEYKPTAEERQLVRQGERFYAGKGCESCRHTGFSGRTGIYELISVEAQLRQMIVGKIPEQEMLTQLKGKGFVSMWEDGLVKVREGITSIAEVYRVCRGF